MSTQLGLWLGFAVFVVGALVFDLGVLQRRAHAVKAKEALLWTLFWVVLAFIFNGIIYYIRGHQKAMEFLTGYLIEKSLSMDNLFVFLVIFTYFSVEPRCQPRVLHWGIIGAIITRAIFIGLGVVLISLFHWVLYIFGALLLVTALKLLIQKETSVQPGKNIVVRWFRRIMPISSDYHGTRFFTGCGTKWLGTPLLVVLVVIESTDIVFAIDSVPAILGITTDLFIVYTSNIFAILGLRAFDFFLAAVMLKLRYLRFGLAFILGFIGIKMLLPAFTHIYISTEVSLSVVCLVLTICVLTSLLIKPRQAEQSSCVVNPVRKSPPETDLPLADNDENIIHSCSHNNTKLSKEVKEVCNEPCISPTDSPDPTRP